MGMAHRSDSSLPGVVHADAASIFMSDLRMLGVAKQIPIEALHILIPLGRRAVMC